MFEVLELQETESKETSYDPNDAGRAQQFCDRWRSEILFVPDRGVWFTWDSGRWMREVDGGLRRRAVQLGGELIKEISQRPGESKDALKAKAQAIQDAARWGNEVTFRSMISMATSVRAIQARACELDANPMLLGTPNAVIDLRTGRARPHAPGDRITQCTRAEYDATATAPRWEKFLEEVFPDEELRRYIWKAAGYSITGDMGEECFFVCHNSGRNGKSKFLGAIDYVLGEYADTAGLGLVVCNDRGEDSKREKAAIAGVRFLRAPETEARQRLNIRAIKDITGGDPINAEAKYQNPFTFNPTCKIWWATNDKPVVSDIGAAIWERIRLIPFERYFEPHERDAGLESKLRAEASGILNWLIAGALLWQADGLKSPAKVIAAVEDYRRDEDVLQDFIEDNTTPEPGALLPHSALFSRYEIWAREGGLRYPLSKRALAKQLRAKRWEDVRTTESKTNWAGVSLL